MRLAIADPPYLGRANRWYGETGRGRAFGVGRPDIHPNASDWDDPEQHRLLVDDLHSNYDGWAIAAHADSLRFYLSIVDPDARVMVWVRHNAPPSGARVKNDWEPVIVYIPEERRARASGMQSADALTRGVQGMGFVGSKPPEWTRWVLNALGYDPAVDELTDLFPGSGAVTAAATGMLGGIS